MLGFLASLLGPRFWITAYIAFVLGFVIPGDWASWRWAVPVLLGGILFFTCLKIPLSDVIAAVRDRRRWRQVSVMTLAKLLLLPVVGWAITRVVAPQWAGGVLLVCAMSAGLSSIAFTDILKGNHVLALLLVVATSLLVPLSVPGLLLIFGPAGTHVAVADVIGRAVYILTLLAVPFTLAQLVRWAVPLFIAKHFHRWSMGTVICSCLLGMVSVLVNRDLWTSWHPPQMVLPLVLLIGVTVMILALGWWTQRFVGRRDAIAFTCCMAYMNNGLSIAFAVRFFPEDSTMVLPSVLMQIPMISAVAVMSVFGGPSEPKVSVPGQGP